MAPKKSSRVKKPSKKLLETLETLIEPPPSETDSESLLTRRSPAEEVTEIQCLVTQRSTGEELTQDSVQERSEDTELYNLTQKTRSLPPTPKGKGKGKGKNTVPVPPKKSRTEVEEDEDEDVRITPRMEEELVEGNPIFYDQRRTDFKNRHKRDKLLQEKGQELGLTMSQLMTWFRNIRTIYRKLKKKKSGQSTKTLTARQQWTHDRFAFLKHHLQVRAPTLVLGGVEPV